MLASKQFIDDMRISNWEEDNVLNFSQFWKEFWKRKISNSQDSVKNKVSYALLDRLKK